MKIRIGLFLKLNMYQIKGLNLPIISLPTYTFNWTRKNIQVNSTYLPKGLKSLEIFTYFTSFKYNLRSPLISLISSISQLIKSTLIYLLGVYRQIVGEGFIYIRGLVIIFSVDALIADDEPIWEPVEWSLLQSWILFIFLFAWIAENLISSRYGSYTGRDKRVWFSWYKTYWLIEGWYVLSMGMASLWVVVPHYYEVTYGVSFIFSWWNWYSRVFIFKFISIYTIILLIA